MPSVPSAGTFVRQVLLTEVGPEGQAAWAKASVALLGEGAVLASARAALESSGIGVLKVLSSLEDPPPSDLWLVLTGDPTLRRDASRRARRGKDRTLFGWAAGGGHALFAQAPGGCPCLECFETLNPKAFKAKGDAPAERFLGAAAATEALLWLLKGSSPLLGRVQFFLPSQGSTLAHPVAPSAKCPALLLSEGAGVTP
jgi:hypothetical protein